MKNKTVSGSSRWPVCLPSEGREHSRCVRRKIIFHFYGWPGFGLGGLNLGLPLESWRVNVAQRFLEPHEYF